MKRWLHLLLPLLLLTVPVAAQDTFPAAHRGFVGARGYVVPPGTPRGTIPPWRIYAGTGFLLDPTVSFPADAVLIMEEDYDVHVHLWLAAKAAYEEDAEEGVGTTRIEPEDLSSYACLDSEGEPATYGQGPRSPKTRSVLVATRATGRPPCAEVWRHESVLEVPDKFAKQVTGDLELTALLVDADWNILTTSGVNRYVARETAFFRSLTGEQTHGIHNLLAFIHGGRFGPLYAPIEGAEVDAITGYSSPRTRTDLEGFYELPYRHWNVADPGLPQSAGGVIMGFAPIWSADLLRYQVSATVRFANFNSRERPMVYFMRQRGFTTRRETRSNFAVDVALAEVVMQFVNDRTKPQEILPLVDRQAQFQPGQTTEYARDDHRGHGQEVLLTQISWADIRDTDIYLYRASDGRLVGSRWGMKPEEVAAALLDPNTPPSFIPPGCENRACLRATVMVRGPGSRVANNLVELYGENEETVELDENGQPVPIDIRGATDVRGDSIGGSWPYEIAEEADYPGDMPLALAQTQAPFLAPGDQVQIIAINRATGYMGTQRAVMELERDGTTRIRMGTGPLLMSPPNLRVEARRTYTVQAGATRGAQREYVIGFEGSGTTDDTYIQVSTEWLDHDGRALPADLPGFTGRMAAISGGELPDGRNDQTGLFTIRPGRHEAVIRLPSQGATQQVYLHVDGAPPTRTFDFAGRVSEAPDFRVNVVCYPGPAGQPAECFEKYAGEGALAHRPADFVPIQIDTYDEAATIAAVAQAEANNEDAPAPIYTRRAAAEMQFSVVDLDVDLERTRADDTVDDLMTGGSSFIHQDDQSIDLSYLLTDSDEEILDPFNPLIQWDTDGDGEPDTQVPRIYEFGFAGGSVRFAPSDDRGRVDLLTLNGAEPDFQAEDLLTLQLLQYRDPRNVLFEYLFEHLVADVTLLGGPQQRAPDQYVLSVDMPELPVRAELVGYDQRDPRNREQLQVRWRSEPAGVVTFAETVQTSTDSGIFDNTMTLANPQPGTFRVFVDLEEPSQGIHADLGEFTVIPGAPASIQTSVEGHASVVRHGHATVTAWVRDAAGNFVADGTGVEVELNSSGEDPVGELVADGAGDDRASETSISSTTVDGRIRFAVRGGANAGDALVKLTAADAATETVVVPVTGLDVAFVSSPTSVLSHAREEVAVLVLDHEGSPVPGIEVAFWGDAAAFSPAAAITGDDGVAKAWMHTGFSSRAGATARAFVGSAKVEFTYDVVQAAGQASLDSHGAMVLGTESDEGTIDLVRFDGTDLTVDYSVRDEVEVRGEPGTTLNVTLGDIFDAASEPVASLRLSRLYEGDDGFYTADETGLHHGRSLFVTPDLANGGLAVESLLDSEIDIQSTESMRLESDVQLAIDVRPIHLQGTVVDHDAIALRFESNRVVATVRTTGGVVNITSDPIDTGAWHRLAVRVSSDEATLAVDDDRFSAPITGTLAYSGAPHVVLGKHCDATLANFRLYDLTFAPLLRFSASGGTATQVTFGATGTAMLEVVSTGQMGASQHGADTAVARVAVTTSEGARGCVSVLSRNFYIELVEQITTTPFLGVDVPEPDIASPADLPDYGPITQMSDTNTDRGDVIRRVAGTAHAFGLTEVWEIAWEIVNFVIPFGDAADFVSQVYWLITGDERADPLDAVMSFIGVLTILPPLKVLKPFLRPLRGALVVARRSKLLRAMFAFAKRVAPIIQSRGFQAALIVVPIIVTVAQIAMDPEAREAISILGEAVESSDDLMSWMRFTQAAGEAEELGYDLEADLTDELPEDSTSATWSTVPVAHAGRGIRAAITTATRFRGAVFGIALKRALTRLRHLRPRDLTAAVRVASEATDDSIRLMLRVTGGSSSRWWGWATHMVNRVRGGIQNFMTNIKSMRTHPLLVVAVVGYLVEEASDNMCTGQFVGSTQCMTPRMLQQLWTKLGLGLAATVSSREEAQNFANGEMFAVMVFGVKYAIARAAGGNGGEAVVAVEERREIQLWNDRLVGDARTATAHRYATYTRVLDVVSRQGDRELWYECKSLTAPRGRALTMNQREPWEPWRLSQRTPGDTSKYYAQRLLDSVASRPANPAQVSEPRDGRGQPSSIQAEWLIHQFRQRLGTQTLYGYEPNHIREATSLANSRLEGTTNTVSDVLRYSTSTAGRGFPERASVTLVSVSPKTIALRDARTVLFGWASQEIIDQLSQLL